MIDGVSMRGARECFDCDSGSGCDCDCGFARMVKRRKMLGR